MERADEGRLEDGFLFAETSGDQEEDSALVKKKKRWLSTAQV